VRNHLRWMGDKTAMFRFHDSSDCIWRCCADAVSASKFWINAALKSTYKSALLQNRRTARLRQRPAAAVGRKRE
jgi:hypothetical protein